MDSGDAGSIVKSLYTEWYSPLVSFALRARLESANAAEDAVQEAFLALYCELARGGSVRSPKGWTGPAEVDGLRVEGTWRAHELPLAEVRTNPAHLRLLESWLRSYRSEELFDESGALIPELAALPGAVGTEVDRPGIVHRLDRAGTQLIVDSGGASTELTMTAGRCKIASASLPVGAALLGAALSGDPPDPLSWAMRARQVGTALAAAPVGKPVRAWATGGSAHNLAGLERTRGKSGTQRLTMQALSCGTISTRRGSLSHAPHFACRSLRSLNAHRCTTSFSCPMSVVQNPTGLIPCSARHGRSFVRIRSR